MDVNLGCSQFMKSIDDIERAIARKSEDYWAEMRSTISLIDRAEDYDLETITELETELGHILDSGILNYPQTLLEIGRNGKPGIGITPKMPYKIKKQVLGLPIRSMIRSENEEKFLVDMAYKAQTMRKSNWSWRIAEEAEQMQEQGWHPFFVTLTVDPKRTDSETLWREGKAFRKYIRSLVNVVCEEMEHPPAHKKVIRKGKVVWDYRPESDYVKYCGVIEHGKSRQHNHGHFLIWLRRIPASWSHCPNYGINDPAKRTNNECLPMRTHWEWSDIDKSPALYFRTVGDIWSTKYNFVLPMDAKSGKPMKVSVPRVAGAYITKYLNKEHKEWNHRMKATRNLGMTRLKSLIRSMTNPVLEALTWRPPNSNLNHSMTRIHSVPLGLLRSEAKRQHYLLKFRQRQLTLKDLLRTNYGVFNRMLASVKDGARPDRMSSSDFFDWITRLLPAQQGFCKNRMIAAHVAVGKHFKRDDSRTKPTKIGGNDIGHS